MGMLPRRRELGCRLGPSVRSEEKQMCLDGEPVLIDDREGQSTVGIKTVRFTQKQITALTIHGKAVVLAVCAFNP